jgi:enamine deaminase RidA (YjgF/YER057c/UK114 family)
MVSINRIGKSSRYSRVVVHGATAYFSGLTSDPDMDIDGQTAGVLAKADDLLAGLGIDRSSLLSATIWLRDIEDFGRMNSVWESWIEQEHPPARATVQAALAAPGLLIEIQLTAAVG